MSINTEKERYNNEGPECPYCGEVVYAGDLSDEDSGELECGACGESFCYEVAVEYSYTTYVKVDKGNPK